MNDMIQQQQQGMFVNGQSGPYPTGGQGPHNNAVKVENMSAGGGHYDFPPHGGMNDFDHQMQMSSDSLFNALASQQNHGQQQQQQPPPQQQQQQQLPSHMQMADVKPMTSSASSPGGMSMPPHHVTGGKPKSHSAAMNQVRNASSWSSLAGGPSQLGGVPGGQSKTSNIGDQFQMFKRQAKEKEARQKALLEQQEMRRQQKEQAERERLRVEADRRREREEEEALEKAR